MMGYTDKGESVQSDTMVNKMETGMQARRRYQSSVVFVEFDSAKKAMTTEITITKPDTTMSLRKGRPMVIQSMLRKLSKKFKARRIDNKAETMRATRIGREFKVLV